MLAHFDHIAAQRAGVRIPFLDTPTTTDGDRSPVVDLYVDENGRLLARRHPIARGALMVCVRHDNTPIWINVAHLAHRNCDDCIDIWHTRGLEHQHTGGGLFTRSTLATTDPRGDNVYLHATELPDTWIDPNENQDTIVATTPVSETRHTPVAQIQDEDEAARLRDEGRSWSLVAQQLGVTETTARLLAAASDRRVADLHHRQQALFDL